MMTFAIPTFWFWFENKNGMIRYSIFIQSDPGYANADKPWENGAKINRYRDEKWTKKGHRLLFGYKFYSLIKRDYVLIRIFKTTTSSLHDSSVDLSEKMKWFKKTDDTLEQNQKVMMQQ